MPANAAKRRRARNERKAASRQTSRRPDGRSAFEHRLSLGMYGAFLLTGVLIVAGALGWSATPGRTSSVHAEVAGVSSTSFSRSAPQPRVVIEPTAVPPPPPAETIAPDVPPEQEQSNSMASGQPLLPALDLSQPAPTSNPAVIETRSIITDVNLTFYDCANQGFCGAMYNGRQVYEGAAACSWDLAIGTKFIIVGDPTHRIYVCEDRGLLPNTWVDIFWYHPSDGYRWQSHVGRYGTIEIVSTP